MSESRINARSRFTRGVAAALAPLALGILSLAATVATAGPAAASVSWPSDWAGSGFCSAHGANYTGHSYDGVAACGNAYPNNFQGNISYNGVELDSVGFQCYELAARYFYYLTGLNPPVQPNASDLAYYIDKDYPQYPVYPAGLTGTTDRYNSTLVDGDIISMWSNGDEVGHVAIVINTALNSSESGTIWVLDENGAASGLDTISVQNGTMNFEDLYNQFQWVYGLPPVGPTPLPQPTYYVYQVIGTAYLHEYSGPSTGDAVVGTLPDHATIKIVCQTTGSTVVRSNIWDRQTNGTYIPDWYTTTPNVGKYSPPIPVC
jgi:hypothetical protein